jgi:hypothetical protein
MDTLLPLVYLTVLLLILLILTLFLFRQIFQKRQVETILSELQIKVRANLATGEDYYLLGTIYLSKKLFDQAIIQFRYALQLWDKNDKEGIAIGDPIENCFCVIITRDGGNSWTKITCENLPNMDDGEAAFAASNTNIIIKGNNTWLVSGGKKTRVFYSSDKGLTWKVYETR